MNDPVELARRMRLLANEARREQRRTVRLALIGGILACIALAMAVWVIAVS